VMRDMKSRSYQYSTSKPTKVREEAVKKHVNIRTASQSPLIFLQQSHVLQKNQRASGSIDPGPLNFFINSTILLVM